MRRLLIPIRCGLLMLFIGPGCLGVESAGSVGAESTDTKAAADSEPPCLACPTSGVYTATAADIEPWRPGDAGEITAETVSGGGFALYVSAVSIPGPAELALLGWFTDSSGRLPHEGPLPMLSRSEVGGGFYQEATDYVFVPVLVDVQIDASGRFEGGYSYYQPKPDLQPSCIVGDCSVYAPINGKLSPNGITMVVSGEAPAVIGVPFFRINAAATDTLSWPFVADCTRLETCSVRETDEVQVWPPAP